MNDGERVPSQRYFAAADHFEKKGMQVLAKRMRRLGDAALQSELIASTKRMRDSVGSIPPGKGEANG